MTVCIYRYIHTYALQLCIVDLNTTKMTHLKITGRKLKSPTSVIRYGFDLTKT